MKYLALILHILHLSILAVIGWLAYRMLDQMLMLVRHIEEAL